MYVLTAVYSDRVIGQRLDDYISTVGDRHIRHWQPYTATDQIVYVADFNYLLNGMQVSHIDLLPYYSSIYQHKLSLDFS